jgi:hypothetical protein
MSGVLIPFLLPVYPGAPHVRYCPINGLGTRLYPCGIANGYAVDLHRGLQTQAKQTQPGVPPPIGSGQGTHREPARIHRVLELAYAQEA